MGMAVILFNGAEPFEQSTLSTEGQMWNLVKIAKSGFREDIKQEATTAYLGTSALSARLDIHIKRPLVAILFSRAEQLEQVW